MKYIVIGCPYTGMKPLEKELNFIEGVECINSDSISGVDFEGINIGQKKILYKDIHGAFIRYPYDLIPPHSAKYHLRERTEYLKTLALVLGNKSFNPVEKSWAFRNRLYSLNFSRESGLKVPETLILSEKYESCSMFGENLPIAKSLGNCFVSDCDGDNLISFDFFKRAEDDGDFAYVFPTQKMSKEVLNQYLKVAKKAFLQQEIESIKEYRVYLICDDIFIYSRSDELNVVDKSAESYNRDEFPAIFSDIKKSLNNLRVRMGLKYLCLDLIQSQTDLVLIDVNPYGSLPVYDDFPEVTNALAKALVCFSPKEI